MTTSKIPAVEVRASAIGNIMTEPRLKADKEAGLLSETAKTYIQEFAIEQKYGRRLDFTSKYTEKGKKAEEDGFSLINSVLFPGKLLLKNTKRIKDGKISGEPDLLFKPDNLVIDNKCSWTLKTFPIFQEPDKKYIWQGFGYMRLTGMKNFWLCYTMVDTPMEIIFKEIERYGWENKKDLTALKDQEMYEVAKNHIFTIEGLDEMKKHFPNADTSDFIPIPAEKRVKKFEYVFDPLMNNQFEAKYEKCQEYLNSIWNQI